MNNRFVMVVVLVMAAACSKKSPPPGEQPAAAPQNAGPETLSAAAFDTQYRGLEVLDRIDKYQNGVVLTGTVKTVIEEEDKSQHVWLDVDGKKWLTLTFTDKGAAVKANKKLDKGSPIKATCKTVVGHADNYVGLADCVLN